MENLVLCGITWPSNFRIIEPGEELIGDDLTDFTKWDSVFGDVTSVDTDTVGILGLPGVPRNSDGSLLHITQLRTPPHFEHQGLVVIQWGGEGVDGLVGGTTNRMEKLWEYLVKRHGKASNHANAIGRVHDASAIALLVKLGVQEGEATTNLARFRRLAIEFVKK